jgi:hypothetical protein
MHCDAVWCSVLCVSVLFVFCFPALMKWMFKFAIDENNMFRGSDAAAHKVHNDECSSVFLCLTLLQVAGHELRGLTNYFNNCHDICFPLMALLDYKA